MFKGPWFSTLPALVLVTQLAACGGGGGGGGSHVDPADLSTPEAVAQVLVPALTVAGAGGVGGSSARTERAGLKRWTPATAKRGAAAPKAAQPCPTSGSVEGYEFGNKDVSSPFTQTNFAGDGYIWRDCRFVQVTEGATYRQFEDGRREGGEDNGNGYVFYDRDGTSDSSYVYQWSIETPDLEQSIERRTRGITHGQYNPETEATDRRIDFNLTYERRDESAEGTVGYTFSAFIGTASEYFQIISAPGSLFLEGEYGVESADFPDCQLGRARVSTPEPLVNDEGTGNLVGLLDIESDGQAAEVLLKADGGADVTIGEDTTSLTAEEVEALVNDCPNLNVEG